ncbi:DUF393 domain-containing protein [Mucilaginibacter sp. KACC 22063]|uniref:DUF393 domain-containing protein n=1 Tax=Mucilaginibacter sp. KACC 22063 TaxID=3025666 RepID=UPI00236537F3|nr:DUF393 domain-containing protein [Mucilaginibacter sp. KACC 22063]WDF56377.1 DUF393 domain-containing protein [Mucilaginibacter sp. KACC 22063]
MNTLKNHLILFDADCPMCNIYTRAFVKSGMLDANGRQSYQKYGGNNCPLIDKQRAVDEIALVNQSTGEVTYGVQSLFKVISNSFPLLKPLFASKAFGWLMAKLYAFVSYNRRVIVPSSGQRDFEYAPTFKLKYRLAYLVFTWAITAFILTKYVPLLTGILPLGSSYREYLICGGQIIFQACIMSAMFRQQTWDYLGNMMTISFAGSLLLSPMFLFHKYIGNQPLVYLMYFMAIVMLMFLEHIRRSKLMGLGWWLTITWSFYRMLVLAVIFMNN